MKTVINNNKNNMELKTKLRIAYRITEMFDFISEDLTLEEINEELDNPITQEDYSEVFKDYEGCGMDSIESYIIDEYFKQD